MASGLGHGPEAPIPEHLQNGDVMDDGWKICVFCHGGHPDSQSMYHHLRQVHGWSRVEYREWVRLLCDAFGVHALQFL